MASFCIINGDMIALVNKTLVTSRNLTTEAGRPDLPVTNHNSHITLLIAEYVAGSSGDCNQGSQSSILKPAKMSTATKCDGRVATPPSPCVSQSPNGNVCFLFCASLLLMCEEMRRYLFFFTIPH